MKAPHVRRVRALALIGLLAGCNFPDDPVSTEDASEALVTNGPAGTLSAQYTDSPASEGVANLMDGKTATKYLTYHSTGWLKWKGTSAWKAISYGLTSANDVPGRDPKSWNLQGSIDGVTWTTLDARSGQTFTSRFQKKSYTIATPGSYVYYKLNVTAVVDPSLNKLQLAEWDLAGASCTSTPIIPYLRVDAGAWQQTSTVTVKAGSTVKFGPQPIASTGWSWSGPNGFTATSREITVTNVQAAQAGNYLVTYT